MALNKKTLNFTHSTDLKLIRAVREYPVLYDQKHERFKDLDCKEVVWQKIGDELKRAPAHCKTRWVNIRDFHRRLIRRSLQNPDKKVTAYKYEDALKFMRHFYRDLIAGDETSMTEEDGTRTDESNENNYESYNEVEPTITVKQEKKLNKRNKSVSVDETYESSNERLEFDFTNPVDTFLMTIGATLKEFSPYRLNLAKTQIFSIVQEHDLQRIMHNRKGVSDDGETL